VARAAGPPAESRLAGPLFWALLATVALAPLPLGANRPAAWSLLAAAVGLLLLLWGVGAARDDRLVGTPWRRYGGLACGFLVFAGWLWLQGTAWLPAALDHPVWSAAGGALGEALPGRPSVAPEETRTAWMRLVCYAGIFFLAMQLGRAPQRAEAACLTVVAAATAYALYGLALAAVDADSILFWRKWAYRESLTATFVNRNHFATYTGLGLLTALALLRRRLRHAGLEAGMRRDPGAAFLDEFGAGGWLLAVAALLLALALLLSHSRAGFAATVFAIAALVTIRLLSRNGPLAGRTVSLLVAAALLGLCALNVLLALEPAAGAEGDLPHRRAIYRATLDGIADRFWSGAGYGGFAHAFPAWIGGELAAETALIDRAHNSYLELAFEAGVPAALLWLGLLGAIVGRCAAGVEARRRHGTYPALGVAVAALAGAHALFDFSLQVPAIAATFALLLGIGYAQAFPTEEAAGPAQPPGVAR